MYAATDPRAALNKETPKAPTPTAFQGAEYARFYDTPPGESSADASTWYVRGQNMIVAYTKAKAGAVLARAGQVDEYVLLLPAADVGARVEANGETKTIAGYTVTMIPPGSSRITVENDGVMVRLFTTRSADLCAKTPNNAAYAKGDPNIPPFESWPAPKDGFRIRSYSLDVPKEAGRFGRIFRCSTIMVNYIEPAQGPRDIKKLSPHHHDDFEQYSLALAGSYTHHLRWPWTPDGTIWREDEHAVCDAPSVAVIPPPAIHTSRCEAPGTNQLVDLFSPPRRDFSEKAGWVLNAADYPMPAS